MLHPLHAGRDINDLSENGLVQIAQIKKVADRLPGRLVPRGSGLGRGRHEVVSRVAARTVSAA